MAKKSKKYRGVYTVAGKLGTSYGIDYVQSITGRGIKKIVKKCTSEAEAFEIRSIELADASRAAIEQACGIKPKVQTLLFSDMIDEYLITRSAQNKDFKTDKQRASVLKRDFGGKLMGDITPWMLQRFKVNMAKTKAKATVNKYLSLGAQVYSKAIEWGKYTGENPFLRAERFKVKRDKKPGSLTPDQVAAIRAGIYLPPRNAWHILRHAWASMFLQRGGDVETLRVMGNWKDYAIPMWYADAGSEEHRRKTLDRLPKVNGRNTEERGKIMKISD